MIPILFQIKSAGYSRLQVTLVDCPGHASLIKTIIGGAQIIDLMVLVVDCTKGIQTQTAECLVIGQIVCSSMLVVLNKTDLLPDEGGELRGLLDRYRGIGYQVVATSTEVDGGLDALYAQLADRTSVFVGQSGVGKSSLIDRLLPDEQLRIGALSEDSRKGRHTTTTAQLYHLPAPDESLASGELIDSPGIREFGLTHLTEREVTEGFIEFAPYLGLCRFRDCRHRQEPGCAIRDAIDEGAIHPERFASYRRIVDSLDSQ